MKKQFRQGDIFIEEISNIPTGATKKTDNVVAVGESMNHAHAVFGEVELLEKDGEIFIDAQVDFELKHIMLSNGIATQDWTKEHHPIPLKKGKYKFVQQQQYNPYEKIAQQVRD